MNKSEKIREYMKANPSKGPKEVADALKSKGIKVTPGLVSVVKCKMGGTATAIKSKPKTKTIKPSAIKSVKAPLVKTVKLEKLSPVADGHHDLVEAILHAKGLVGFAGSLDKAKNFLDLVSRV